jgi:hypothetical protein
MKITGDNRCAGDGIIQSAPQGAFTVVIIMGGHVGVKVGITGINRHHSIHNAMGDVKILG